MQHLRADIAQLAQLAVSHAADRLGIVYDARVCHQNAGDVRPVFVHVRTERRRGERAGDVAAATGEGFDVTVRHHAVKAGNDDPASLCGGAQCRVGGVPVDAAIKLELDPQRRV